MVGIDTVNSLGEISAAGALKAVKSQPVDVWGTCRCRDPRRPGSNDKAGSTICCEGKLWANTGAGQWVGNEVVVADKEWSPNEDSFKARDNLRAKVEPLVFDVLEDFRLFV